MRPVSKFRVALSHALTFAVDQLCLCTWWYFPIQPSGSLIPHLQIVSGGFDILEGTNGLPYKKCYVWWCLMSIQMAICSMALFISVMNKGEGGDGENQ